MIDDQRSTSIDDHDHIDGFGLGATYLPLGAEGV